MCSVLRKPRWQRRDKHVRLYFVFSADLGRMQEEVIDMLGGGEGPISLNTHRF